MGGSVSQDAQQVSVWMTAREGGAMRRSLSRRVSSEINGNGHRIVYCMYSRARENGQVRIREEMERKRWRGRDVCLPVDQEVMNESQGLDGERREGQEEG